MFATDTNAVIPSARAPLGWGLTSIGWGVTMTRPINSAASKPGDQPSRAGCEPFRKQQLERDRCEHGQLGGPERLFLTAGGG